MTQKPAMPVPPRLSMEAYADFVSENWNGGNSAQMRLQKTIEERINKPFSIPSCQQVLATALDEILRKE